MSVAHDAPAPSAQGFGRRRFFELAGTAGAAAIIATGLTGGLNRVTSLFAAGDAVEALVLNCMDYRLANELTFLMNEQRLTNSYDQIVLAGATLGVATDQFPAWATTFWDHLDLAINLHGIKRVIAVDHRDCGAYKLAFNQDFGQDPAAETDIHTKVMSDFRDMVKKKQPTIEVELLLMSLDGRVEPIGVAGGGEAPASAPVQLPWSQAGH